MELRALRSQSSAVMNSPQEEQKKTGSTASGLQAAHSGLACIL